MFTARLIRQLPVSTSPTTGWLLFLSVPALTRVHAATGVVHGGALSTIADPPQSANKHNSWDVFATLAAKGSDNQPAQSTDSDNMETLLDLSFFGLAILLRVAAPVRCVAQVILLALLEAAIAEGGACRRQGNVRFALVPLLLPLAP